MLRMDDLRLSTQTNFCLRGAGEGHPFGAGQPRRDVGEKGHGSAADRRMFLGVCGRTDVCIAAPLGLAHLHCPPQVPQLRTISHERLPGNSWPCRLPGRGPTRLRRKHDWCVVACRSRLCTSRRLIKRDNRTCTRRLLEILPPSEPHTGRREASVVSWSDTTGRRQNVCTSRTRKREPGADVRIIGITKVE
jgi:hypothetical protein